MYLRLSILIMLCLAAWAPPAEADDHLTGTVTAQNRDNGTIVVRTDDNDKQGRDITIHMKVIPKSLQTGSQVRARGRFLSDDHTSFEADRLKIKHEDPSGVRERLRVIPRAKHDQERPVIRIPDIFKFPETSR